MRCIAGKRKASKAASKAPPQAKKAAGSRAKSAKEASPSEQGGSDVEVGLSEAEEEKPQASSSSLQAAGENSLHSCMGSSAMWVCFQSRHGYDGQEQCNSVAAVANPPASYNNVLDAFCSCC